MAGAADGQAGADGGGGEKESSEQEVSCAQWICFGILDVIACIVRGLLAVWHGFVWITKRAWYPVKETFIEMWDAWEVKLRPWKKKQRSEARVPVFHYDSMAHTSHAPSARRAAHEEP